MFRRSIFPLQNLLLIVLLAMTTGSRTAGQGQAPTADMCVGDCNHSDTVTVDELVLGVNISLGNLPIDSCPVFDADGDGHVSVDELIQAVNNALNGCPAVPTATVTLLSTPTQPAFTETPTPAGTPTPSSTLVETPTETLTPSSTPTETPPATPTATPTLAETPTDTPTPAPHVALCDLPGSVQTTANGLVVVPGGPANATNLSFLHLPVGFCAHFFANVGNTRQLRFAPGGELFIASPTTGTTGGGPGGQAGIIVLPDDDHDGVADTALTFLSGLPSTQGLLFTGGYLYYQDATKIMRMPYAAGERTASGTSEQVANITIYISTLHWPKTLDVADDGTIYVGNGGDQGEMCDPAHPFHGGILKLDGSPGGTPVAKGFRNPISLRCARGHDRCFAIELTRDFTADVGGREKLVPIRQGDDWGFPCCATNDLPFPDIRPVPDCSTVAAESDSFIVGNTPFDLDFETGKWPAPWNNRVYVPMHGTAGSWQGARMVSIGLDPTTGELLPGSDIGGPSGAMVDFATGWDDGTLAHGRPAAVAFAPDGRLFLGNDTNGDIIWIAPLGL
jgi:glucose/arabinose dehydrogenase